MEEVILSVGSGQLCPMVGLCFSCSSIWLSGFSSPDAQLSGVGVSLLRAGSMGLGLVASPLCGHWLAASPVRGGSALLASSLGITGQPPLSTSVAPMAGFEEEMEQEQEQEQEQEEEEKGEAGGWK